MGGWDFSILWEAGNAILNGQDPYSVNYFYYPLPFAYFLSVFALFPLNISYGLWICINLGFIIYSFRKDFWVWLFYTPVLHQLSSGQVDMMFWFLERGIDRSWRGAVLGALITLKPQLAVILLSWHLFDWIMYDRKTFLRWLGCSIFLWGLPVFWRPFWFFDWVDIISGVNVQSIQNSPGFFGLMRFQNMPLVPIILIAAGIFIWGLFKNKQISRASALLASPFGLFYSTLALMDNAPALLLVPMSLLAVILTLMTKTFIPFTLLPLAVIGWQFWKRRNLNIQPC